MRRTHVLLINVLALTPAPALAQNGTVGLFRFFDGRDIDYWGEGKTIRDPLSVEASPTPPGEKKAEAEKPFSGSSVIRGSDASAFSWSKYQDPRAAEFWDDGGDWVPPRPFREAAANPTAENMNEYLAWQARKTTVVNRFQEALQGEVLKTVPKGKEGSGKNEKHNLGGSFPNWRELKIAYFYQSACGHCRESAPVVEKAKQRGARVTFVQLDSREKTPLHAGSIPYDASWAKEFPISVTPTWLLKLGSKTVTVTGALSFSELEDAALKLSNKE